NDAVGVVTGEQADASDRLADRMPEAAAQCLRHPLRWARVQPQIATDLQVMAQRVGGVPRWVQMLRPVPPDVEVPAGIAQLLPTSPAEMKQRVLPRPGDIAVLIQVIARVEQRAGIPAFERTVLEVVCNRSDAG